MVLISRTIYKLLLVITKRLARFTTYPLQLRYGVAAVATVTFSE